MSEVHGKSAATGRPHYFGRLYEDTMLCVFCGEGRGLTFFVLSGCFTLPLGLPLVPALEEGASKSAVE